MASSVFYRETFNCLVRDRERILFEGSASAVSTWNDKGVLDVLPEHIHFISIIGKKLDIIRADGKTLSIPVSRGILRVYDDEVRVYLGIFSAASKKA